MFYVDKDGSPEDRQSHKLSAMKTNVKEIKSKYNSRNLKHIFLVMEHEQGDLK